MQDSYGHCERLVRETDRDRFLAALFAPADRRPHLLALDAFNVEIARIRELAREPLPGEIRLQWWRDSLAGQRKDEARAHPVAAALLTTLEAFGIAREPLFELIDARTFDLYRDAMPTIAALEDYARKTSSGLIASAAALLDPRGTRQFAAAEPAGIAFALAALLQAFPVHAARGQLYLPLDLLARHGVGQEEVFAGKSSRGLVAALAELRDRAQEQLAETAALWRGVPGPAQPAFLPVALTKPLLARLQRNAADPFARHELPQWRRQLTLWRASRKGFL